MPKSFLEKYYDDNNPVLDRLNIVKKILIRLIILIVCTIWFLGLYVVNANNIFSDVSPELLIFVYIVMGLSALISIIGIVCMIIRLSLGSKFYTLISKTSYKVKKTIFTVLDWFMVVPICICIALTFYGYVFRIQLVEGNSMEPSFSDGNRVITIYDRDNLKRGDVVIAYLDPAKHNSSEKYLIKRVIGLPGDTIKFIRQTQEKASVYAVEINGERIKEPYILDTPFDYSSFNDFNDKLAIKKLDENGNVVIEYPTVIPEGYVFIMGDNRNDSSDSREYGLFEIKEIMGVVILKVDGLKPEIVERGVLE